MSHSHADGWIHPDGALLEHLALRSRQSLESYRVNPLLVDEHVGQERAIAQGGYGRRQVFELVQNGADALVGCPAGRIQIVLTPEHLYCANEGKPIEEAGIDAILHAHLSVKRGSEIGRFGLGFKSVLGVSSEPEFYCRAGSFGFDAARAAADIREIVPRAAAFPTLRVAYPIDHGSALRQDPVLAELSEWAMTIVRLKRNAGTSEWLQQDIEQFPAEFLLFCPHIDSLALENRSKGLSRRIRLERQEDVVVLHEQESSAAWKVFSTTYRPSTEARREAGELAGRDELPIIWAVPLQGRREVGRLWAFFPLNDDTTLKGVLNAPWKTNDDRTSILPGIFNRELLDKAADLVVASLPSLRQPEDPAWYLDVLPGRGREIRNWADGELTEIIYKKAAAAPSVPDLSGQLRKPAALNLHPESIPKEVLEVWAAQPTRPTDWCHSSVETRERRPRVNRLFDNAGRTARTVNDWLMMGRASEHARSRDPASYGPGVLVAAALLGQDEEKRFTDSVRQSWILFDASGVTAQLLPDSIFLPGEQPTLTPGVRLVHPKLIAVAGVEEALLACGIRRVDASLELEGIVGGGFDRWEHKEWDAFWELTRRVPIQRAFELLSPLREEGVSVKVRTAEGNYVSLPETLQPGPVVPDKGSRDRDVAIDTSFHVRDLELLRVLGATGSPQPGGGWLHGTLFKQYRMDCVKEYFHLLEEGSPRPAFDYLQFEESKFAGPIDPLIRLSPEGRAIFTAALIASETEIGPWRLGHSSNALYPTREFPSPTIWSCRRSGCLTTSLGPRRVRECVSSALGQWREILPVALDSTALLEQKLELPIKLADLAEDHWVAALQGLERLTDDLLLGGFYAAAARCGRSAPASLRCRTGQAHNLLPCASVTAIVHQRELTAMIPTGRGVLLVPSRSDADMLVRQWGLTPADPIVRTEPGFVPSSAPLPLIDRFPGLAWRSATGRLTELQLQSCSELWLETMTELGMTREPCDFHIQTNTVYWLDRISAADLLRRLASELAPDLTDTEIATVVEHGEDNERRRRVLGIRREPDPARRLLAAVGVGAVRRHLPLGLVQAVEFGRSALDDIQIADLAAMVFGADLLDTFRPELEEAGLEPPKRWAGSQEAQKFVRELGFDREYAGYPSESRPALWSVDGPQVLPELHSFQQGIVQNIRRLLSGKDSNTRGLLSLPTGAGKTRVAVQSLIEALRDNDLAGPILWVAQSDELCEQAVRSWAEVWRAKGVAGLLHIGRLWASNEVTRQDDGAQVVVATIQKLQGVFIDAGYDWLAKAAAIVVDEAHMAVPKTYTALLEWQGLGRGGERQCPLIGLTATAYRGNKEETERLVARFARNRLEGEVLGDDPYQYLQKIGVLAHVEHRVLGGSDVTLSADELAELERFSVVPSSVDNRLAADAARNVALVDDIMNLDQHWPTIVFTISVEHAQTIAALLIARGRSAAPISANTQAGARKTYIERFKSGDIAVLTNYGVLTQGFDAPAVRAVYVARPTFSPNLYQQMIGRGLRGPENGGKEKCLIVTVEDNFAQYGRKLAFEDFEYLWSH